MAAVSLDWEEGEYGGSRAYAGRFLLSVSWGSGRGEKYRATFDSYRLKGSFETQEEARSACERIAKAMLTKALEAFKP